MSKIVEEKQSVGQMVQCPRCSEFIPKYPQYSPWCETCEWNLQPSPTAASFAREKPLLKRAVDYSDYYVFNDVSNAKDQFEGVTFPQIASLTLSSLIFVAEFLFLYYSVVLLFGEYSLLIKAFAIVLGVFTAWTLIPRFDVQPDPRVLTDDQEFPAINRVVAQVAMGLGVEMPSILMTEQFTATFGRIGPRRRPVLALGHPLLSILTKEELVSLLAHEVSHSFDGSLARSIMVRQSIAILRRWQQLLTPSWFVSRHESPNLHKLLLIPTYLFIPLSLPVIILGQLLNLFCMRDCQRAEYVADARSIRVAGNVNTLQLLRKSYYRHLDALTSVYQRAPSQNKYTALRQKMMSIPEREVERVWRIAQREPVKIDNSHPRLSLRIAFLESMAAKQPALTLSDSEFSAIQKELEAWPCIIRRREASWNRSQQRVVEPACDTAIASASSTD